MSKTIQKVICGGALVLSAGLVSSQAVEHELSVKQLMEGVITPATNALWEIYEPESEEDWLQIQNAAMTTIAASTLTAVGGAGSQDMAWANDPIYQVFNQAMLDAAKQALQAAINRDVAAFQTASEVLYPPCEACHLQFNPAVVGQPQ